MAIRPLVTKGNELLRRKSKEVKEIDKEILTLIEDMKETMYKSDGVGIAAPQVGVLKRVVVIDVGFGAIVCINPKIVDNKGEYIDIEGCLSVPGVEGEVKRPEEVTVNFINPEGKRMSMTGKNLLARAFCHEIDHLEGILFVDKLEKEEV